MSGWRVRGLSRLSVLTLSCALSFLLGGCTKKPPAQDDAGGLSRRTAAEGTRLSEAAETEEKKQGEPGSEQSASGAEGEESDAPGAAAPGPAAPGASGLQFAAKKSLGVPVHPAFRERAVSKRGQDGARVEVLEMRDGGHWLRVRYQDAAGVTQEGWVIEDYLKSAQEGERSADAKSGKLSAGGIGEAPGEQEAFAQYARAAGLLERSASYSPEACLRVLEKKRNGKPKREQADAAAGVAPGDSWRRLYGAATFNIRWFPDGRPGKKGNPRVNPQFLACTLALLEVPVIALQEMKRTKSAERVLGETIAELNQMVQGDFVAIFDECPAQAIQHVGFLYDRKRVRLLSSRVLAELNPHGDACEKSLRPGLLGEFEYLKGGERLNLVAVHLKSGTDSRDHELRKASMRALAGYPESLLLLGDFNTMGCAHCATPISPDSEREILAKEAGGSFLLVSPECSQYYRGQPGLLDGAFFLPGKKGAAPKLKGKTWAGRPGGICEDLQCQPAEVSRTRYSQRVSDHCPVAFYPEK